MAAAFTYRSRIADRLVEEALAALGAVVIEGPRACGKTETARQHVASEVLLDVDPQARAAAAIDPALVLDGPTPRLLDEWQREPRLWDSVRRAVDARGLPGQFVLTGSARPTDDVPRHSGAGRFAMVHMRPMTLFEQGYSTGAVSLGTLLDGAPAASGRCGLGLRDYVERVVVGGWPGLLGRSEKDASVFVRGWLDGIVEHDLEMASGARRDPEMVRRFLRAYAQLVAHPVPLSKIIERARQEQADVDAPSRWAADPYLEALRRLMVVDEVEAWNVTLRSRARLMSVPKRHLVDASLAAALMDCAPERLLGDLNTLGYLFESLATRDVRVYAQANHASVFHYRERGGELEVDVVVERRDGEWAGFEVKLGGDLIDEAAAALLRLAQTRVALPPAALVVLTGTEYAYRRKDGVLVVPLGLLGP
jgi:predicted AAA+ superfamily ATPase